MLTNKKEKKSEKSAEHTLEGSGASAFLGGLLLGKRSINENSSIEKLRGLVENTQT